MYELAERLLKTIRKHQYLRAGDRVAVAVSGGADSVALLRLLLELRRNLGLVLSVAHVNHKLRGQESDDDEQFVSRLAARHGLELFACAGPVDQQHGGIETAARRSRYQFFRDLARQGRASRIATAHTLDDQAETVLLRIFRGTGIRGLAGILPRLQLSDAACEASPRTASGTQHGAQGVGPNSLSAAGEIVRPLLEFRRAELRTYLRQLGQEWREDSSNADVAFLRNRVRQRLLPLVVEEFGDAAVERLANLAEIARAEEEGWDASSASVQPQLDVQQLVALPLAAARRAIRAWLERSVPGVSISFRLIEDILDLAHGETGREVELPGTRGDRLNAEADSRAECAQAPASRGPSGETRASVVRCEGKKLVLELRADSASGYEYRLLVPGEVSIAELGLRFAAEVVPVSNVPEAERLSLLDAERVGGEIVLRNWRAGDRFWPAHTSREKKVKELLSDRHLTGREKSLWPVAVCQDELVWMRGFAAAKAWQAKSEVAVWIRQSN